LNVVLNWTRLYRRNIPFYLKNTMSSKQQLVNSLALSNLSQFKTLETLGDQPDNMLERQFQHIALQ